VSRHGLATWAGKPRDELGGHLRDRITGALGVIVTIRYQAVQTRQNTRAVRGRSESGPPAPLRTE
jgi:hypothetical protein